MIHTFTAELKCSADQTRSLGNAPVHEVEEEEERPSLTQKHGRGLNMALAALP